MFIDSGEISLFMGKEPPVMTTSKELKKNIIKEKINCSGLEKNLGRFDKKRELGLQIFSIWSNNTQLLTYGVASSSKGLILFF